MATLPRPPHVVPPAPLILFDGVCNLCSAAVNFVIDRDPAQVFRFASLQSEAGQAALLRCGIAKTSGDPDSVILVEGARAYDRSTAALRVTRRLAGAWRLLYVFVLVPKPLRDWVYKFVARNRYRWFGKSEVCRVPTPELKARFL